MAKRLTPELKLEVAREALGEIYTRAVLEVDNHRDPKGNWKTIANRANTALRRIHNC